MKNASWASTYYWRCLALLGFFLASPAFADCPGFYTGICKENGTGIAITLGTPSGVCNDYGSSSVIVETSRSENATFCTLNYACSTSGGFNRYNTCGYLKANFTPSPTPSPTPTPDPNIDRCEKLRFQWVGSTKDVLFFPSGVTFEQTGSTACLAGCAVMPSEIATGTIGGGEKRVFARGPFMNTGNTCTNPTSQPTDPGSTTGTPVPTPVAPPDLYEDPDFPSCAKGTCPGTVNGQNVCVPCEKTKTESGATTTEKTKEDGNKEIKEVSSETVCNGSFCVTIEREKTTVKDTQGNTVGTPITTETSKTEPNDTFCVKNPTHKQCTESNSFCKENPELSICKEGKWSETSCDSAPACSGDAVQCAQAANAFKNYCESKKTADALYGTGQGLGEAQSAVDSAMSFGSGSGSLLGDSGSVGIGSFDQSNPWGSSCLPDTQVAEFEGKAITIPFSKYCSVFELMGRIAVAATLLAAGLFVFRD